MACRSCEYFDENETYGYGTKGYCTYYGVYEYPDSNEFCKRYKERGGSGGSCYITSACCAYRGLADDCRELGAMRRLRDVHLSPTARGRRIVADYYREAPRIVEMINASQRREELYDRIFDHIAACTELVEAGDFTNATDVYLAMMRELREDLG